MHNGVIYSYIHYQYIKQSDVMNIYGKQCSWCHVYEPL